MLKKRYLCRRMRQFRQQIISYLLLLTIGFYLGSSTLFIHSHTIDGIEIVHSHPFSGNPSSHSHSESSIGTINRIFNPEGITPDGVAIAECIVVMECKNSTSTAPLYATTPTALNLLRAPPTIA